MTVNTPALPLWTRRQVATVLAADVAALAVMLFGAWRAAAAQNTQPALRWLIVAILGLGISGFAQAGWIARNRQAVRFTVAGLPAQVRVALQSNVAVTSAEQADGFAAVQNSMRYHRAACAFVAGREVIALPAQDETLAARYPCEVCCP